MKIIWTKCKFLDPDRPKTQFYHNKYFLNATIKQKNATYKARLKS